MTKPRVIRTSRAERGQVLVVVLLVLGIFMIGAVALSVDFANGFFHRQSAQDAADAACTAGIMDIMSNAQLSTSLGNFPSGSPPATYSCSGSTTSGGVTTQNSTSAACQYAALNGYSGSGLVDGTPSNDVQVSFPGSVTGVTTPPSALAAYPFMQVNVTDRVPTFFSGMITGRRTIDVGAQAVCAVQQDKSPIPIIVLNPSCKQAFDVSGSATVSIIGGPSRSVQVDSNNSTCAAATDASASQCGGSGHINLSQAGPNFDGADFGVTGAPTTAPTNFTGGVGHWVPASVIGDPYALLNKPAQPAATTTPTGTPVPYGTDGCPDHSGCTEFRPGLYTSAIQVPGGQTSIFMPGVYYITGIAHGNCPSSSACTTKATGQCNYGLILGANTLVRPGTSTGTYDGGTMFYLSGTGAGNYGSVFIGSSSGSAPGGHTVDNFAKDNFSCPGAGTPPAQLGLPALGVSGNVLLGQCTANGTWVGSTTTTGISDTAGTNRGLIFFQDRANADASGQASMQGGGGLVISGNMYFHNCNSSGSGTGCDSPTTGFNGLIQLQGTPGAGTYVLGNITADSFVLSGNGSVAMALNPNAVFNILKASLVQ